MWNTPLEEYPDGSYAIFRADSCHVELVSDVVGSRTIWYHKDDEVFVASTSQRAIVMFLRSYVFDERVIPWVLSNGFLGPSHGWDRRVARVPPDTALVLDRDTWALSSTSGSVRFCALDVSEEEHETLVRKALVQTFADLSVSEGHWVLPLSGGHDSRAILGFLQHASNSELPIETVTWGLESSRDRRHSDAWVARRVAAAFGVSNDFYHTDISAESIRGLFTRFLMVGEGRVDHIAAYMDGFSVWKALYENGVTGILRGDEAFGLKAVSSELTVRLTVGLALCSDYPNLRHHKNLGIEDQVIPQLFLRREGESLSTWCHRVYLGYRIPVLYAAWADLKLSYVEQICPLLSRGILERVMEMPDHLRTDKALFRKIVASSGPKVEFARASAIASMGEILGRRDVVDCLKEELSTTQARSILPQEFLDCLIRGLRVTAGGSARKGRTVKARATAIVPRSVKNMLHDSVGMNSIDGNILAFRAYMLCRMVEILNADAAAYNNV